MISPSASSIARSRRSSFALANPDVAQSIRSPIALSNPHLAQIIRSPIALANSDLAHGIPNSEANIRLNDIARDSLIPSTHTHSLSPHTAHTRAVEPRMVSPQRKLNFPPSPHTSQIGAVPLHAASVHRPLPEIVIAQSQAAPSLPGRYGVGEMDLDRNRAVAPQAPLIEIVQVAPAPALQGQEQGTGKHATRQELAFGHTGQIGNPNGSGGRAAEGIAKKAHTGSDGDISCSQSECSSIRKQADTPGLGDVRAVNEQHRDAVATREGKDAPHQDIVGTHDDPAKSANISASVVQSHDRGSGVPPDTKRTRSDNNSSSISMHTDAHESTASNADTMIARSFSHTSNVLKPPPTSTSSAERDPSNKVAGMHAGTDMPSSSKKSPQSDKRTPRSEPATHDTNPFSDGNYASWATSQEPRGSMPSSTSDAHTLLPARNSPNKPQNHASIDVSSPAKINNSTLQGSELPRINSRENSSSVDPCVTAGVTGASKVQISVNEKTSLGPPASGQTEQVSAGALRHGIVSVEKHPNTLTGAVVISPVKTPEKIGLRHEKESLSPKQGNLENDFKTVISVMHQVCVCVCVCVVCVWCVYVCFVSGVYACVYMRVWGTHVCMHAYISVYGVHIYVCCMIHGMCMCVCVRACTWEVTTAISVVHQVCMYACVLYSLYVCT
jgi:hypothetical protein